MKIYAFIAARSASSRLPKKLLQQIRGKSVIEHVIERAKSVKGVEGVVLCTSTNSEDDALVKIAQEQKILFFRGSLEDKLARFLGAAEKFGADYFANIDSDDPFFDPELVEKSIEQIKKDPAHVIKSPSGLTCGAFTFLIKVEALREVCRIKDTTDTEMYEVYFLEPRRFEVRDLKVSDKIFFNDRTRLTLDYPEDLEFFKRVFDELQIDKNTLPLRKIHEFLEKNSHIAEINISRHKDYLAKREIMKKSKKLKK